PRGRGATRASTARPRGPPTPRSTGCSRRGASSPAGAGCSSSDPRRPPPPSRRSSGSSRPTPRRWTRGHASVTLDAWAGVVSTAYGLPDDTLPWFAAIPETTAWQAFVALEGDERAGPAPVCIADHAAYI